VARNEHGVVAHGPEALGNAGNQGVVIALRKIGAPNAASKQHIAHKSTLDFWRIKNHMARGVAWAMAHIQCVRTQLNRIAILQPTCRRKDLSIWKLKHAPLI
jgi:hypothetical protein